MFDKHRPLSWSAISSFEYDPKQWYRKYVLGEEERPTPELRFGKKFADAVEAGKPLAPVTVLSTVEYAFEDVFLGKIPLVGYADTFDTGTNKALGEFKTGVKPWDQKRVDEHGQIDMYLLMNYLKNHVRPEDVYVFLQWVPTEKRELENGDFTGDDYEISFKHPITVYTFPTRRTMEDVLRFGARVRKTYKAMEDYCKARHYGTVAAD